MKNIATSPVPHYHPGLQRFISQDPIGFAGEQVNLYAYVDNSPLNFTDPYGLIGYPAAYGLGCALGVVGGSFRANNPVTGGIVGGVIGATFAPFIVAIPPGPFGAAVGVFTGAVSGFGAAAAGGGNPFKGAAAGAIGGGIGGLIGGGGGAAVGAFVSTTLGALPW